MKYRLVIKHTTQQPHTREPQLIHITQKPRALHFNSYIQRHVQIYIQERTHTNERMHSCIYAGTHKHTGGPILHV